MSECLQPCKGPRWQTCYTNEAFVLLPLTMVKTTKRHLSTRRNLNIEERETSAWHDKHILNFPLSDFLDGWFFFFYKSLNSIQFKNVLSLLKWFVLQSQDRTQLCPLRLSFATAHFFGAVEGMRALRRPLRYGKHSDFHAGIISSGIRSRRVWGILVLTWSFSL